MEPPLPFLSDRTFWSELGLAAAILLVTVAAARVLLRILGRVVRRFTHATDTRLDDALLTALYSPLYLLVLVAGLRLAVTQLTTLDESGARWLNAFFFLAYTLIAYAALYRTLRAVMTWYLRDQAIRTLSPVDEAVLPFVRRVLLLTLSLGTFVFILQHFQVPIGSLVATLGIGSLAVALAAQSTLSDLFAGFFIMLDRRYRIGDRIELTPEGIVGDVVDIGLRTTRILTMDHRMVIVPNAMLASNIVVNHAYPDPNLRVDLPVQVAYGVDFAEVKALLIAATRTIEGIHPQREADVIFTGFGESALRLEIRCWINAYADKPKISGRINEAVYSALREAGIEIPYPHRVVYLQPARAEPPRATRKE